MTDISQDPVIARYRTDALATAVIPTPNAVEDAAAQAELHLEHARKAVAEEVDEDAADRLVAAVQAHGHDTARSLVAVVGPDDVAIWGTELEEGQVRVTPGPLPDLGRLLVARQSWVPHAVVEVDRAGADLTILAAPDESTDVTVEGAHTHLTKSNPGGWSQRRFQQRAEEHWEDNVRLVVDRLLSEVDGTGVELVLATGGEQIITMLRDALPTHLADGLVDLHAGGRAEDGSEEATAHAVDQAVRQAASVRRGERIRAVTDAVGQGRGVTGRDAVLRSLFEGTVDTVVVQLEAAEGLHGYVGDEPAQVAADSSTLHQLDLKATRVPLVDAVLRGAAATGAQVVAVVTAADELEDGVAASLRG